MRKYLVILVLLCLLCSGCKKMKAENTEPLDEGRFALEYNQRGDTGHILILRDSETGQKYLFVRDGYAGGLTKLE